MRKHGIPYVTSGVNACDSMLYFNQLSYVFKSFKDVAIKRVQEKVL